MVNGISVGLGMRIFFVFRSFISFFCDIGRGTGLFVSLFIYTRMKKQYLFLFYAIFNIVGAIGYSIYCILIKRKSSSTTVLKDGSNDLSGSTRKKSGKLVFQK